MTDSQKWKAISKLLNHDNVSAVQPIQVKSQFLFEDQSILVEMEKYYVEKPGSQPTLSTPWKAGEIYSIL